MAYAEHERQAVNHRPFATVYADAAARLAALGFNGRAVFSSEDLYKVVLQVSDYSQWMLVSTTPTWIQIQGGDTAQGGALSSAVAMLLGAPGIRGVWTLGSYLAAGTARDSLGSLHLTRTGVTSDSIGGVPASYFSVGTDRLAHVDAAAFDILGNEAYTAVGKRGLTFGAWVRPSAINLTGAVVGKWGPSQRSYIILLTSSNRVQLGISADGSAGLFANSPVGLTANNWHFVAGRYKSSTPDIKVWLNLSAATNSTSIPATLFDSSAEFRVGQSADATAGLVGHVSLAFLAHEAWSDDFIEDYIRISAPAFGVIL